MSISWAILLVICIVSGGATNVRASIGAPIKNASAREVVSATTDTSVASASDSTLSETSLPLEGRWSAAETAEEKKQRLEAIDAVTKDMGRFKKGKARSRLAERTSPPPNITIEVTDLTVAITIGDRRLELELGGSPIEIEGDNGTTRMSAKMEGEQLVVLSRSDTGEFTVSYKADKHSLSRQVTMKGEKLAGPLTYSTTYARMD